MCWISQLIICLSVGMFNKFDYLTIKHLVVINVLFVLSFYSWIFNKICTFNWLWLNGDWLWYWWIYSIIKLRAISVKYLTHLKSISFLVKFYNWKLIHVCISNWLRINSYDTLWMLYLNQSKVDDYAIDRSMVLYRHFIGICLFID